MRLHTVKAKDFKQSLNQQESRKAKSLDQRPLKIKKIKNKN